MKFFMIKFKVKFILMIFFLFNISLYALAQPVKRPCTKNGKSYPHGTELDGYRCDDGKWRR